ncbi:SMEK domain-containing protein [Kribbella sp. NPDC051936]|uniref:SMEK domain-containing protein n=1 Tax=Kribbella sp. NPDC051936 TaxID=3154946 RepID=UPI0034255C76
MNKVEAQQRVIRNLAVIRYQIEALGKNGQNISIYTETAVLDSLNAATRLNWRNVNASANNFPGVDLITPDGVRGVQATARATKAKLDKTIKAITGEFARPNNRLANLTQVEVVGLSCVRNSIVTTWRTIPGPTGVLKVRGIDLLTLLKVTTLHDDELSDLDRALQGLAMTSPFQLRSDKDELRKIIAYLDRPAIRDKRQMEMDWRAMEDAMISIRRLLAQGANDGGYTITRPYQTFQPETAASLKEIYVASAAISSLLKNELHSPGSMADSEWHMLEGHRLRIQETVTRLADTAEVAPPIW